MKPYEPLNRGGRGWHIVVDELVVPTRIGLHAQKHLAPQPVAIDASLQLPGRAGRRERARADRLRGLVHGACPAIWRVKSHTRLLKTLAVEIAALSFTQWPAALDALTLLLYKPKIREGTRRVGVELDWHRANFDAW